MYKEPTTNIFTENMAGKHGVYTALSVRFPLSDKLFTIIRIASEGEASNVKARRYPLLVSILASFKISFLYQLQKISLRRNWALRHPDSDMKACSKYSFSVPPWYSRHVDPLKWSSNRGQMPPPTKLPTPGYDPRVGLV